MKSDDSGVYRIQTKITVKPTESCWFAARGEGASKRVLWSKTGILKPAIAHTAAVPHLIDNRPIAVPESIEFVRDKLQKQEVWYRKNGRYPDEDARLRMITLFRKAISILGGG